MILLQGAPQVSGAKAEDIYTVELVEHDLREPHAADRAGVIKSVCAVAAQEHGILHAFGGDRGGEILGVPDALFLLIIGIPHVGKHEVDAVRSLEGPRKEGDVAHVADGGLSAELDQTFEILGTSPDDGHIVPLLEEPFRQRLRYVARRTRDDKFHCYFLSLTRGLGWVVVSDGFSVMAFIGHVRRRAGPTRPRR
jgi:hypothetical protein